MTSDGESVQPRARDIINELLRFALMQDKDFQKYKTSSSTGHGTAFRCY
jgi:hypothetical protein